MTQEIINRLKELLTKATEGKWFGDGTNSDEVPAIYNERGTWLFAADDATHQDRANTLLAAAAVNFVRDNISTLTNLTPSGVERIRALVREMEELPEDLRLIVALTDDGRKLRAMLESAALPSEPPSQGDVEGRARLRDEIALQVRLAMQDEMLASPATRVKQRTARAETAADAILALANGLP